MHTSEYLSFRANSAPPLVVHHDLERRLFFFFFDFSGNPLHIFPALDFYISMPKPSSSSSPSSSSVVSAPRRHKRKKAHHQKPPFMLRLLLFLSRAGVNINRPPPLKKLLAGIVGCLFLLVVALVRPSLRASTRLNGEKNAVRCARTFPDVASHQLLTNDPTTKSGGFEAMDYMRDRYGVTNYDIGTLFLWSQYKASRLLRAVETSSFETNLYVFSSFLSFDRLLFADDINARDDADREDTRGRQRRQTRCD